MAAPLSGIGQQQQVPLSQTFQPGGTDQSREIRQREQQQKNDETQIQGASSARSQETSTKSFQDNLNDISVSSNNSQAGSAQGRGTVVDIVV